MNGLIVFAKAPIPGQVKTRLLPGTPLNEEEVCGLYRSFLRDVLKTAGRCKADRIVMNFLPAKNRDEMKELALESVPEEKLVMEPQEGRDFTERIANSFRFAAESGLKNAVMIGSDSPTLQSAVLNSAFEELEGAGGVVLGPSGEGGLYLIGMESSYRPDFAKIFSGSTELSNFVQQIEADGKALKLLEEVTDVDVAGDLVSLISLIDAMKTASKNHEMDFPANTAKCLEELALKVVQKNGTRNKAITRGDG